MSVQPVMKLTTDLTFKQLGVMERGKVIPLIIDKLLELGKVVDIKYY